MRREHDTNGLHMPSNILHIIRPNDTFYELARFYNTSVESLMALNPSTDPRNLQIGTSILVRPGLVWGTNNNAGNMPTMPTTPNTQTTSVVLPNRVHPVDRTPPTNARPNLSWPIFRDHNFSNEPSQTQAVPFQSSQQQPMPIQPMQPLQPQTPPQSRPLPVVPIPPTQTSVCSENSLCSMMRLLWSQHVYWTRMLINSIADKTPQQNAVATRLLQNPGDMGNLYSKYYGNQVGQRITQLFTEHLNIGGDLFTAMRDRRQNEIERLRRLWYTNADNIANAFGQIAPNYNAQEIRQMINQHLEKTDQEAMQQMQGNTTASIQTFNAVEREAMQMADYFANAIINERQR